MNLQLIHYDCIYCQGKVVKVDWDQAKIDKWKKERICNKCKKKYPHVKFKQKIPFKDKVIVMIGWFVLVTTIRILLYNVEPNKWLGSLGALTISVVIMYILVNNFGPLKKHRPRIIRVLRFWYQRRVQALFISFFILYAVWANFVEYGYSKYGEQARAMVVEYNALYAEGKRAEAEELMDEYIGNFVNQTLFPDGEYIGNSIELQIEVLAFIVTTFDATGDERIRFGAWMVLYEDAEFLAFLYLVRSGRLFKREQNSIVPRATA